MAEHLTRLAKEMKTSRTALVQAAFDEGYAKLCKAERRIKRKGQTVSEGAAGLPAGSPEVRPDFKGVG